MENYKCVLVQASCTYIRELTHYVYNNLTIVTCSLFLVPIHYFTKLIKIMFDYSTSELKVFQFILHIQVSYSHDQFYFEFQAWKYIMFALFSFTFQQMVHCTSAF